MSADPTAVLLRLVVRALPERRAEWGQAMQAELTGVVGSRERRRFVLGCTAVVLRGPAGIAAVGWLLARVAVLAAAIMLAWAIDVPRIRIEAIGAVALLLGGFGLLRGPFGPGRVSSAPAARIVAGGGAVIAATQAMLTFHQLHVESPLILPPNATVGIYDQGRATADLVALIIVLGAFLIALAGVTARRSTVSVSTVATGAGVAAGAAAVWLVVVLLYPHAATVNGPSLLTVAGAGLVAVAVMVRRRHPATGRPSALVACLLAAVGTTFLLGTLMDLLTLSGGWVSNSSPPSYATPPPTRIVDTVVVYLPGLVLAVVLAVVVLLRRSAPVPKTAA